MLKVFYNEKHELKIKCGFVCFSPESDADTKSHKKKRNSMSNSDSEDSGNYLN